MKTFSLNAVMLLAFVAVLLLFSSSSWGQPGGKGGGSKGGKKDPKEAFEAMAKGRGYFTVDEAHPLMKEKLAKFMMDQGSKDGKVTLEQYLLYVDQVRAEFTKIGPGKKTDPREAFDKMAKGRGYINVHDVNNPVMRKKLDKFVKDQGVNDGKITLEQYVRFVEQFHAEAAAKTGPDENGAQDFVYLADSRPLLVRAHVHVNGKPLQTAWDEFAAYLFNRYDTNHDGILSQDELDKMPPIDQIRSGGPAIYGYMGRSYSSVTEKKEAKLDLAEFAERLRTGGLAPVQLQAQREQDTELMLYMGTNKTQPPMEAVGEAIFNLLDTNRDGKISRDELAAVFDLLRLDTNDDELLTAREIAPSARATAAGGMMMGSMGRSSSNSLKELEDKSKIIIVNRDLAANLPKRLQDTYFRKAKRAETPLGEWIDMGLKSAGLPTAEPVTGKTKEKMLTRADLGLDAATFAALDTNGDGKLDEAELGGFVKRGRPDVEFILRLGQRKAGEDRVQILAGNSLLADKILSQPDFAMIELGTSRTELRGKDGGDNDRFGGLLRQQQVARFKRFDRTGKGYVEASEASGFISSGFKAMDRNGDGKVTEVEFLAYLDDLADLKKRSFEACVSIVLNDQSRGLFDQLDVNRDGKLGVRELRGAVKLLERLDPDGKGYITRADVPRSYRLTVQRGPATEEDAFSAQLALIYGMGETEEEEVSSAGPAWFRKMDRNRDGDVSRGEWLGSDEVFRLIDTDGDGLISLEEAMRYDAERRRE